MLSRLILAMSLLLAGLGGLSAQADSLPAQVAVAQAMRWNDYNAGLKKASQEKKFVMMQFYATWCGYCRKMDQVTFQDAEVQKSMQRWFVPIRVTERSKKSVNYQGKAMQENDLLPLYQISAFPSMVFLGPEGQKLTLIPGYLEPAEMGALLKFIGTRSFEKMTLEQFKQKDASSLK